MKLQMSFSLTLCALFAIEATSIRAAAQDRHAKRWAPAKSGVTGTAVIGPISPVERPGVPNTRPLPGAVITVHPAKGGNEVARATTDENGRFKIRLLAGSYRIMPLPPKPGSVLPRGEPQEVSVRGGAFTKVTVRYDSGIR